MQQLEQLNIFHISHAVMKEETYNLALFLHVTKYLILRETNFATNFLSWSERERESEWERERVRERESGWEREREGICSNYLTLNANYTAMFELRL